MASRKAADSTLYHLSSHGFWKKFRDIASVNPSISSGLPIASINRYPQPASRPEKYSTPATKASDPAENPYWKRDVRRAYPQLSVVTQAELSTLLIGHSEPNALVSSTPRQPIDLSEAVTAITQSAKVYTESRLPPSLPISHKSWVPQLSPAAPHEPHSYYPMSLYR
jgi:hypothetical protein